MLRGEKNEKRLSIFFVRVPLSKRLKQDNFPYNCRPQISNFGGTIRHHFSVFQSHSPAARVHLTPSYLRGKILGESWSFRFRMRNVFLPWRGGGSYLNNRVLLSKAPSCDRLPEEIWCSQQILVRERSSRAYTKFEHQISEGTYHK